MGSGIILVDGRGSNGYAIFRVGRRRGEPLLRFLLDGLRAAGCRVIFASPPVEVPFRIAVETAYGARHG